MKLFGGKKKSPGVDRDSSAASRGDNINKAKNGNNKRKEKKKRKGKGWLIALIVVVAIVLGAFAYWEISTRAPKISAPKVPGGEAVDVSGGDRQEGVYTLLVVGNDQEGLNTDTLMLMKYDSINKTANVISIPRDTMVNVKSDAKKINAIYHNNEYGGIDALMDVVQDIAGFRPDNYILVDTGCFIDVIDAMGGVYFNVPLDMDYDDYADTDKDGTIDYVFTIHVKEGYQLLNGYDALGVFRYRHTYAMGDIQRLGVQHDLLMAAAEQFMSTRNLFKLYQVASIIMDNATTDLNYGNLQWYAQQFLGMSMDNISFSTIPTTGTNVRKISYVTINVDEWIDMINSTINPLTKDITKKDCSIVYWTVTPTLKGNQYYSEVGDFATTDGKKVDQNFLWGQD